MRIRKIFALLLTVAMLTAPLASCDGIFGTFDSPASTTPAQTTPENTTPEDNDPITPPEVEGMLTCVNIIADSITEAFAAAELKWYLTQKGITMSEKDGYPITLSVSTSSATDGYKIEATDEGLTITGGTNRGLAYGVYNFLEKFVGVKFYAANTIVMNDAPVIIETGVLDEYTPAFEILRNPWQPIEKLTEKNGGNLIYHDNLYKTITLHTLIDGNSSIPSCLTAADNVTAAINRTKEFLATYPSLQTLVFSPDEDVKYCTCESCAAVEAEEGGLAGAYVRFVNAIIEAVTPEYAELGFYINVDSKLLVAPKVTKPADGVVVCISTADCHATHAITDESCSNTKAFAEGLKSWAAISSVRLEYVLSSTEYISTFANIGTLRENMRFFAESGIDSIYCTGNFSCLSGEFGELRAYLMGKLLQNPMMSEEEYTAHMNEFLSVYYGKGWVYVRNYIEKVTELANNDVSQKGVCGQSATASPLSAITRDEYLAYAYSFENCWNAAEQLAGDRVEYVQASKLQWQYIQACITPSQANSNALINAVKKVKIPWRHNMTNVSSESNLTLPPFYWKYTA